MTSSALRTGNWVAHVAQCLCCPQESGLRAAELHEIEEGQLAATARGSGTRVGELGLQNAQQSAVDWS